MTVGSRGCHERKDNGLPCGKPVDNSEAPADSLKSQYCTKHYKQRRRLARAVKREIREHLDGE